MYVEISFPNLAMSVNHYDALLFNLVCVYGGTQVHACLHLNSSNMLNESSLTAVFQGITIYFYKPVKLPLTDG